MSTSNEYFAGRLGLESSDIPHKDRHGLVQLSRGRLFVESGTLRFECTSTEEVAAGCYAIPYQQVSMILLGPGSTVTHDALRLLARHDTLIAAVGEGGVKCYTAPPLGQMGHGRSRLSRRHAQLWANSGSRLAVARRMYEMRFGVCTPHDDISVLRGIEGGRMKELYKACASRFRVPWVGRRYDRSAPLDADIANQAINHAATFVEAAADIATSAVGALPPLGFIHEDSGNSFVLDIADLFRAEVTLPVAFRSAKKAIDCPGLNLEREVRRSAAMDFRTFQLIPKMIDSIKELLDGDGRPCDP
jgi:CRISPR-associated protein Cas1